jgi:hypothetical protein
MRPGSALPCCGYETFGIHVCFVYSPRSKSYRMGLVARGVLGTEWLLPQIRGISLLSAPLSTHRSPQDSLRHRLSNSLIHYQQLKQLVDVHLRQLISNGPQTSRGPSPTPEMDIDGLYSLAPSSTDSLVPAPDNKIPNKEDSPALEKMEADGRISPLDEEPLGSAEGIEAPDDETPSSLLCNRCPICFGGPKPNLRLSR